MNVTTLLDILVRDAIKMINVKCCSGITELNCIIKNNDVTEIFMSNIGDIYYDENLYREFVISFNQQCNDDICARLEPCILDGCKIYIIVLSKDEN